MQKTALCDQVRYAHTPLGKRHGHWLLTKTLLTGSEDQNRRSCFSVSRTIVNAMKLTILFLTLAFLHVSAGGVAQTVSFSGKNVKLEKVFSAVEKQTGYVFFYDAAMLRGAKPITINAEQVGLEAFMQEVFKDQPLIYLIENTTISLRRKAKQISSVPSFAPAASLPPPVSVKGKVIDEKGQPVANATVSVKGKKIMTFTNEKGEFSFSAIDDNAVLVISSVSFESREVKLNGQKEITVQLNFAAESIKEVVVSNGYFTRDKNSYTGASRTIKRAEIQKYSSSNLFTLIQNIDAGFKVQQDNNFGSDPNKIPDMTIRGRGSFLNESTAPVFIVDGFELAVQRVFDLDVNRIESITLLKDASATILYGSRAANGVVVIETRSPAAGKLRITYDVKPTVAIADLTDYHLMDARQKLEFEKLAGIYTSTETVEERRIESQKTLDGLYYDRYRDIVRGVNTDWLSQPVRNAVSTAHSLFLEGGSDEMRYGVDLNYNNSKGVMKESGRDRYGLGFNLTYRVKNKLTFRNYATYSGVKAYNSPYGTFSDYTKLNPYEAPLNENGEYKPLFANQQINPLYNAGLPNRDFTTTHTLSNQFNVDWFASNGIRVNGAFRIQKDLIDGQQYTSPKASVFLLNDTLPVSERGSMNIRDGKGLVLTGNVRFSYKKSFGHHTFLTGLGAEMTQNESSNYSFSMTGFADDRFADPAFAIMYRKNSRPSSSESTARSIGLLGNLNYIYNNRYFADLSFRQDGSSRFGANNRFAPFYSLGAGWNIHKENFWTKNDQINELRIRGSYGITGNQEFSAYQARTSYQFNTDRLYYNSVPSTLLGYGNENLKWQRQVMSNIGTDIALFNSRIRINAEYYIRKTDGLLTDITVAPSLGFPSNSYKENLGEIQNKGFELNLNAIILKQTNSRPELAVSFQGASNKSKILKISNELKLVNQRNNAETKIPRNVYEEGESMTAIKAVRSLGIDPANGKELFMTRDGKLTYTWNAEDKVNSGDTEPTLFGNMGTNLAFKGWNLNMTFQYRYGGQLYNQTLVSRIEGADPRFNADIRVLDERWKHSDDWTFYKDIAERTQSNISDRFIQKENTLALTSLSVSYDLEKKFIKKAGLERARATFYMNDVSRLSTIRQERGLDYPFARSFVLGLNVVL